MTFRSYSSEPVLHVVDPMPGRGGRISAVRVASWVSFRLMKGGWSWARDAVRHPVTVGARRVGFAASVARAVSVSVFLFVLGATACGPEKFDRSHIEVGAGGVDGGDDADADADIDAAAPDVADDSSDSDAAVDVAPTPIIRSDFETSDLGGWQPVGDERPPDVLDTVAQSTADHHHGAGSLAMGFNGVYTPLDGGTAYYGVYTNGSVPPANAQVSLWLKSTVGGASVMLYAQLSPDYLFQNITSATLTADTWTKVVFQMPPTAAFYLGCLVTGALNINGTIFLDEISW
jgi:hypothetical protein